MWVEESCVRDSMFDASVGVLSWYISVVFGILMEIGDVEFGLGFLYSIFTQPGHMLIHVYTIQVCE